MTAGATTSEAEAIRRAVATVTDPEYPDVSIVDLGLLERVDVDAIDDAGRSAAGRRVTVELVPTYAGCPALEMIAADVRTAVEALGHTCEVRWLTAPAWSPTRIAERARQQLADDYAVAVRDPDGRLRCPVCGSTAVPERSPVGPTRCRAVHWCAECRNAIEVVR